MAMFKEFGYFLRQTPKLDSLNRPSYTYIEDLFYCNEKSIGQSEFYQAESAGLKPEIKLETKLVDLSNVTHVKYKERRYKILRTFKKEDIVEITLTSLINENDE